MSFHKNLLEGDIHIINNYEYANAGARTGASGFVSADIGKVAHQTDNNTFWILVATTPTWVEITNTSGTAAAELVIEVQKESAGTINAGDLVYVAGYDSGDGVVTVELADASAAATMPCIGMAQESFTESTTGSVAFIGDVGTLDTSSFSVGDTVYVSETAGEFSTKPTGSALVQPIGIVVVSHASTGRLFIFAGEVSSLPNLDADHFWLASASGVPTATQITDLNSVTAAATDVVMIGDASDTFAHKKVTAQSIADLSPPTTPAGSDTQVQFNESGAFGADAEFIYNTSTKKVTISGSLAVDNITTDGNTVSSTDTNGDINLSPNGTGTVVINTDLDVDNLNLNGNTIISSDTNGNVEVTPNGTGKFVTNSSAYTPIVTLTDAATVAVDASEANSFIVTLGGNRSLGAASNTSNGQVFRIIVKQDGTGSRTLSYDAVYKFPGGTAPTLTTTAGAVDILSFYVEDSSNIHAVSALDFQ